ncbi:MAG: hypothetical protein WAU89_14070 [Candidatus Acidiferrales bacterium]
MTDSFLAGQSFPDLAVTRQQPFANYSEDGPNAGAGAVVEYLLRETDLLQLAARDSLTVSVGAGNWISWSFRLHSATNDPIGIISKLWNGNGKRSFRRCWRPAGKFSWFRSIGAPSLHFEVVHRSPRDEGARVVRGHVDAADPWSHPLKHLVEDYLPALGIAKHPGPDEMLKSLLGARK